MAGTAFALLFSGKTSPASRHEELAKEVEPMVPQRHAMAKSAFSSTADFLPRRRTLGSLRTAAEKCHGCPLYARATQTVFGEGPASAQIVMIGEQPGDHEDRQGHPFVGPAGRLLDKTLEGGNRDVWFELCISWSSRLPD